MGLNRTSFKVLVFVAVFQGNPVTVALALSQPCQRVDRATLTAEWDPLSIVGEYRIQWISIADKPPRTSRLRLFLWKTSMRDSSTKEHKVPALDDTVMHPIYGTLVPDSGKFSKDRVARLRSEIDPMYPPVLLMTRSSRKSPTRSNEWTVLLLDTVGNRRDDVVALDGGGTGMWIRDADANGFRGTFEPWGIVMDDKGYYCARRVQQ
jgi:hypothetical protein